MSGAASTVGVDPLTQLAIRCGTDKWGPHFYTPIYHELFSAWRHRPVRLLEIGIGGYLCNTAGGASLAMWGEYFPHGRIVGIDRTPKRLTLDPRITLLTGSQADARFLADVCDQHGPFDIVIDDGSHRPQDVVASFYALFPRLADRGLYIIEDVQTAYWPKFGGSPLDGGATMKIAMSMLDCLNHAEIKIAMPTATIASFAAQVRSLRAYHNLIVIEKGDNSEPSNYDYSPSNPHAAHALRTIEAELAHAPTPEGIANLVAVYLLSRDYPAAEKLAGESLQTWPDHPALLYVAYQVADACGNGPAKLERLRRLARQEPDNADLADLCRKAEASLAPR